mmetsp:Transcript_7133/g.15679  ORF Transcript_7133/g.15679 Transcript_7133/m.15679 type:complete len:277 (+) Transcript_7133:339-1169(+)
MLLSSPPPSHHQAVSSLAEPPLGATPQSRAADYSGAGSPSQTPLSLRGISMGQDGEDGWLRVKDRYVPAAPSQVSRSPAANGSENGSDRGPQEKPIIPASRSELERLYAELHRRMAIHINKAEEEARSAGYGSNALANSPFAAFSPMAAGSPTSRAPPTTDQGQLMASAFGVPPRTGGGSVASRGLGPRDFGGGGRAIPASETAAGAGAAMAPDSAASPEGSGAPGQSGSGGPTGSQQVGSTWMDSAAPPPEASPQESTISDPWQDIPPELQMVKL